MDIAKFSINTDYRNSQQELHKEITIFADIVFVDKTQDITPSILYQLEYEIEIQNEIVKRDSPLYSLYEKASLIGEIVSIDRKKKQIFLQDKRCVRYNYLVAITNKSPFSTVEGKTFASGLHTLIEALRIRAKIPSSFAPPIRSSQKKSIRQATAKTENENSCPINALSVHPDINNKKLCEVQL